MKSKTLKLRKPAEKTSTDRARLHLDRLAASSGKRRVFDLPAEADAAMLGLLDEGYAGTKKDVVSKALLAAYARRKKK